MIEFESQHPDFILQHKGSLKRWIKQVLESEGKTEGELVYIFSDDEQMIELNRSYLNHDTYTDIITFPTSHQSPIISGDIFISIDRVRDNALLLQSSFEIEFKRVLVHGILHLIGYDDHTDEEKLMMRSKEDYYLSLQPEKN